MLPCLPHQATGAPPRPSCSFPTGPRPSRRPTDPAPLPPAQGHRRSSPSPAGARPHRAPPLPLIADLIFIPQINPPSLHPALPPSPRAPLLPRRSTAATGLPREGRRWHRPRSRRGISRTPAPPPQDLAGLGLGLAAARSLHHRPPRHGKMPPGSVDHHQTISGSLIHSMIQFCGAPEYFMFNGPQPVIISPQMAAEPTPSVPAEYFMFSDPHPMIPAQIATEPAPNNVPAAAVSRAANTEADNAHPALSPPAQGRRAAPPTLLLSRQRKATDDPPFLSMVRDHIGLLPSH